MNFNFITKREADKAPDPRRLVTKQTFFAGENRIGYFEKETFSQMMEQMKDDAPNLFKQYRNFFTCIKDGLTVASGINKNKHKVSGAEYYYLRFKQGNIDLPTTIYEQDRLGQFIKDYAYGRIKTDFTIDDLIEEARSN